MVIWDVARDWTDMLLTVAGYGVVSMDVRGQSGYSQDGLRSPLGNTVKGHIIRGAVEGKEQLFYKDVYLDIYQLIEIVASLPEVDEGNWLVMELRKEGPWL